MSSEAPTGTRLVLILVGGNLETIHDGGIWKLYCGRDNANGCDLVQSLIDGSDLNSSEIAPYYFSWTGDNEDHRGSILPGHPNWILGGARYIQKGSQMAFEERDPAAETAIVGRSNGGATAYELACLLGKEDQPNLLVTLDPVSWTTSPCNYYSNGEVITPKNWITVYTRSSVTNRLKFGNILAFIGRAWNNNNLPTKPREALRYDRGNHGDTKAMWNEYILCSKTFREWLRRFDANCPLDNPHPIARVISW